ncbi:MAG: molybdenum cofactor guanylyltransferase MobA, partial [Aeromonas sp.]
VSFADQPDAFLNLNSPDELASYQARRLPFATDLIQGAAR